MSKGGCLLMYNPYSLEGKTILVTGASSGIGRATAIECSKLGAKCVITARNEARLQKTFSALEGVGHEQIVAELTNDDELEKLVQSVPELDGFVCCAGISQTKLISFAQKNDLENMFAINAFAPFILTKELIKKKKIKKNSSIVLISSLASKKETYGNSIYGMTKAALESFAKYCALENAQKKIRVNSIHPGMVNTEMIKDSIFSDEMLQKEKESYPLKRFAEPQEIAWAIIYLLSDASAWITGTQLIIDGGVHLV
jgi:NAD(P)-dependent dehydrogenase (short-subunit alcohol dehydrogenase family)